MQKTVKVICDNLSEQTIICPFGNFSYTSCIAELNFDLQALFYQDHSLLRSNSDENESMVGLTKADMHMPTWTTPIKTSPDNNLRTPDNEKLCSLLYLQP